MLKTDRLQSVDSIARSVYPEKLTVLSPKVALVASILVLVVATGGAAAGGVIGIPGVTAGPCDGWSTWAMATEQRMEGVGVTGHGSNVEDLARLRDAQESSDPPEAAQPANAAAVQVWDSLVRATAAVAMVDTAAGNEALADFDLAMLRFGQEIQAAKGRCGPIHDVVAALTATASVPTTTVAPATTDAERQDDLILNDVRGALDSCRVLDALIASQDVRTDRGRTQLVGLGMTGTDLNFTGYCSGAALPAGAGGVAGVREVVQALHDQGLRVLGVGEPEPSAGGCDPSIPSVAITVDDGGGVLAGETNAYRFYPDRGSAEAATDCVAWAVRGGNVRVILNPEYIAPELYAALQRAMAALEEPR